MSDTAILRFVELSSIAILIGFTVVLLRGGARSGPQSPRELLSTIALIACASWVAEVSCIRLYAFYQYDAPWLVFVDVMPLLVCLIWPFVILSARELIQRFGLKSLLGVFVIVLYDASLIEPVAVRARLWSWNEPGIFGVPPIGILGWAYFSFFTIVLLDRLPKNRRVLLLLLAPLATHAALLATWWGVLRWLPRSEIPGPWLVAASLVVALLFSVAVRRFSFSAPLEVMLPRMAGAILFFCLLALRGSELPHLILYGALFSVPYMLATRFRASKQSAYS